MVVSDEANFTLAGGVNSQNVRKYKEKKTSNREEGGRPDDFVQENPTFSEQLMVFAGMKGDETFGLTIYRNKAMNGKKYHRLLQHNVLPELCQWNGGNLDIVQWTMSGGSRMGRRVMSPIPTCCTCTVSSRTGC